MNNKEKIETEVGIFPSPGDAQRGVRALESNGLPSDAISMINDPRRARDVVGNRLLSAILVAMLIGAAIAGALAFLVPGAEIVRNSPLTLALWIAIGAFIGFIAGDLGGRLVPLRDARLYQRRVEQGAVLVRVTCSNAQRERVRRLLAEAGAQTIRHEREAERPTP